MLLTIEEVAERLRVSRSQIREFYRYHGLPIVRLSHRTLRVRERDLEEWLESHVESGAVGRVTPRQRAIGVYPSRLNRMASDDVARSGSSARRPPRDASSKPSSAVSLADYRQKSPA